MGAIDDLDCDLEILRDVVFQIEQNMKTLGDELARAKRMLADATRAMQRIKLEAAQQTRH